MKKKIFIGIFIFLAINIVVACAKMSEDAVGILDDQNVNNDSNNPDNPNGSNNSPNSSPSNDIDATFNYFSNGYLTITNARVLEGLLRSLNLCGMVNTDQPYPGYYTIRINIDLIFQTHDCNYWKIVRIKKISFSGAPPYRGSPTNGRFYIEFHFADGRGIGFRRNGSFKLIQNSQNSEIVFSQNKDSTALENLGMVIRGIEFRPDLSTWEKVEVSLKNGDQIFAKGDFQGAFTD